MSQDTFPFAGTDEANHYDEADAAHKKKLAVIGGLVVLAVGGAAFLFLGGGSGDGGDVFIPRAPRAAKAADAPAAVKKAAAPKKLPAAYSETIGRDPFRALYVVPAAGTASTTSATTATSTSPNTVTSGGDTASVSATQASPAPAATHYALKLVSVSKPSTGEVTYFTWLVAGTRTVVVPAQRFGKYGELVVLATEKNASGTTTTGAVIQVGDDSPIDVMIGESVSVL